MKVDGVFQALGDATRRALVQKISQGPVAVSQLAGPFEISLAAVLQHVQILEESGLIRTQKAGRVRTCLIEPAALSMAEQWLTDCRSACEGRFGRLRDILAEPD